MPRDGSFWNYAERREKQGLKVFSPEDLDELLKKTAAEFLQLL